MQWLADFIYKVLSFIPRLVLVEPNEGGIRLTFGSRIKELKPGWYIWCPLFQQVIKVDVVPQVVDLRAQSIYTKDHKQVIVSGAIQYKIVDVVKTLLNVQDWDKSIQVLALGVISEYIKERTLEECNDFEAIRSEIRKKVAETMGNWGLKIQQVYITDFAEAKSIRVISDLDRGPMIVDGYE